MKKLILISLIFGAITGHAFAGYYIVPLDTAAGMSWTENGAWTYSALQGVSDQGSYVEFAATMGYSAGANGWASTYFSVSESIDLSLYDGIGIYVANANDDQWEASLSITTNDGTEHTYTSGFTTLIRPAQGSSMGSVNFITIDFYEGMPGLDNVTEIGLWVGGDMHKVITDPYPSNPDHFTVAVLVPLPATIMLGFLGLAAGGWKLRKSL